MADNTMTLALEGNVPLRDFATAIDHFHGLVEALAVHYQATDSVEWFIDDLVKSSAIATVRGESQTPPKSRTGHSGIYRSSFCTSDAFCYSLLSEGTDSRESDSSHN